MSDTNRRLITQTSLKAAVLDQNHVPGQRYLLTSVQHLEREPRTYLDIIESWLFQGLTAICGLVQTQSSAGENPLTSQSSHLPN